jgi:protein phosphatase
MVGATHIGLVREKNEDRYLMRVLPDASVILAVADGMGGEPAGDVAAEIMTRKFEGLEVVPGSRERQLSHLVREADQELLAMMEKDPALQRMGTTVTAAWVDRNTAYWVHVGDCRLYLLRRKALVQVTSDQNLAQFLVEEGEITAREAKTHRLRHALTQCVGHGECRPDTGRFDALAGDLLFLATDGLHDKLLDEDLAQLLSSGMTLESKSTSLIQAALHAGGSDNITVVIGQMI